VRPSRLRHLLRLGRGRLPGLSQRRAPSRWRPRGSCARTVPVMTTAEPSAHGPLLYPHRPTQAVVLAGGQGSRLRPYTDDRPKPMVEIPGTGTPIIGHQLTWLAEEGVTDAVVSCGHLAEVLQDWLKSADLPLRVTTVVEKEPLGRGGGLKFAAAHLPHQDRPWYATNGDIWTRFSLREMADFHHEREATATLA